MTTGFFVHGVQDPASGETVRERWSDVSGCTGRDENLESVTPAGPFVEGSNGTPVLQGRGHRVAS